MKILRHHTMNSLDMLAFGTVALTVVRDIADGAHCLPLKSVASILMTIFDVIQACLISFVDFSYPHLLGARENQQRPASRTSSAGAQNSS
jgi:hypothetical protein